MSLDSILGTASSGLASINQHLAVVSQNVANAGTAGYQREVASDTALTAGGQGLGVRTGLATRVTDAALQAAVSVQAADLSALGVRSNALSAVDVAQGTTGAGNDIASRLGALQDAFTALDADPSDTAQQAKVVGAATTLAGGIRDQADAYAAARQDAQDGLVSDVASLDAAVQSVGKLSQQIIAARSRGESTADLESQRAAQEQTAAQLGGLTFLPQANGDVLALAGASVVDTRGASGPFAIATATLGTAAPSPALTLSGADVTGAIRSGSIGARLALRDTELPTLQAGLDQFATTLASRFVCQGLRLFTDPQGGLPTPTGATVQAGIVGWSSTVQVNPAVSADPALVRDGTEGITAGTGGASAFTPNPANGPAGFTTTITRVLSYAFGAQAQDGVAQPAPATAGLGQSGTLSLSYTPGSTLASFASNLVASQSQAVSAASAALDTGQATATSLQSKLSAETGVSMDTELSDMVTLQNAYGANAKVLTAVQSMWTDLLNSVGR